MLFVPPSTLDLDEQTAAASVRVGALRNGKEAAIESAIDAAYDLFCNKQRQMTAVEVVSFVCERVPGIDPDRIRVEFAHRLRQWGMG
jgi:hypothetical protein